MKTKLLALILTAFALTASAALPNPKVCAVTVGATDATLTWDAVPGSAKYRVWKLCTSIYGQQYCWWEDGGLAAEPWKYLQGLKPGWRYVRYVTTDPNPIYAVGAPPATCSFRTLALPPL